MKALSNTPLFRFNRDRSVIIERVVERVTRQALQNAWSSAEHGLEYLLNEAAYMEMSRLDDYSTVKTEAEHEFWRKIAHSVGRTSEEENADLLRKIVQHYTSDIAGHFKPSVYRFATRALPAGISFLFSKQNEGIFLNPKKALRALEEKVRIEGEVGKLAQLAQVGTLIIVPTHSSHLDSPVIGWAMHKSGLPPVTYGAGKNLFSNPMTSFFMANLGAYKVDRRLQHTIYKSVLKTYSQVLIERGYHSLFFPNGGRTRSNQVEDHLKLGLLGTALDAYTQGIIEGRRNPDVFIVPVTINYNLILEAETMIDEHLKRGGRERYIVDNDEFTDVRRVAGFVRSVINLDSTVTVRFGTPMDVFGNEVDQEGRSRDQQGRIVLPARYLWIKGVPKQSKERDQEYTRKLGKSVVENYQRNNVIYPIHIVSFALFEHLRRQHPQWDLYRTLRFARGDRIETSVAEGETERLFRIIRRASEKGKLRLAHGIKRMNAQQIISDALQQLGSYHTRRIAERYGTQVVIGDAKLLFFYGNRLRGYEFERQLRNSPGGY